jgi:aryl-alcohol dehydrogenase-like predicted oxidoreductase
MTNLKNYTTLGRSGLRVNPLCLGTMTFGTGWGWGVEENIARDVFHRYIEVGGNFIDTADGYAASQSEAILGRLIAEDKQRDRLVLATKFTFNADPANANAGGNGRKNIYRALEGSLQRLQTDYVDLYWLHAWDTVTPVEEVVATLNDLVRAGKIRYYGFSDTPAWYLSRAYTLAEQEGKERLIALQLEYSLVERTIEREHIPAAQELGLGVCPWSSLAAGFLTGKYKRAGDSGKGDGRLEKTNKDPVFERFTERNWGILDVLLDVAKQAGKSPAQVALNWAATQPGVSSVILGASSVKQLDDNLGSIEFTLAPELRRRLDEATELEPANPYQFFGATLQSRINGGMNVQAWKPADAAGGCARIADKAKATAAD